MFTCRFPCLCLAPLLRHSAFSSHLFCFFSKLRCSYGEYNLLAWHKSHGLGSKVSPTRPNKYRNYRRWLTDTSLPFNFCMCTQASYIYLSNSILIGWTNGRKVKAAAVGSDISDVYFLWHGALEDHNAPSMCKQHLWLCENILGLCKGAISQKKKRGQSLDNRKRLHSTDAFIWY